MKKVLFILMSLILMVSVNVNSQENYTLIGENDGYTPPYAIWKIEVLNSYNNAPITNAHVDMDNGSYQEFSIRTNDKGIAVVIIYDITKLRNGWNLKIVDNDYNFTSWEKEINQYDYYGRSNKRNVFAIADRNNNWLDWSDGNNLPSDYVITNRIFRKQYKIVSPSVYNGPAFFEFNVVLTYNAHGNPQNQIHVNNGNYSNNSSSNSSSKSNKSEGINGWVKGWNEYLECICYTKGRMFLVLQDDFDKNGNYIVAAGTNIHSLPYVAPTNSNTTVSLQRANQIARNYMNKH